MDEMQGIALDAAMGQSARVSPFQNPMNQFPGSIILLTNPESGLYRLELTLRMLVEDKEGNLRSVGPALMNDEGVNAVIGQTQTFLSQEAILSNFEHDEVIVLVDFLGDTLARDLMVNRVRYCITTPAARDRIYFLVLGAAFVCLKRAQEEGERRFWKGSQQEITTRVEGLGGKKGGNLLSSLMNMGKN